MKNLIKKWAKDPNRNLTKDVIQTANRQTKRYSTAYVFREMQIKTMRYHNTPSRRTKIRNTDTTKHRQGFGAAGTLIHCRWECKMVRTLWKIVWQFLTKLNIFFPYNSAMMLLDIYPKKLETYVHIKTWTQMFTVFFS